MYKFIDTPPIDPTPKTESGNLVTIDNEYENNAIDSLTVSLDPVQDLNGYSHPWAGGLGKNKLQITNFDVGEAQTKNGITCTYNADGSFTLNGTTTATNTFFNLNYTADVLSLPLDKVINIGYATTGNPNGYVTIQATGSGGYTSVAYGSSNAFGMSDDIDRSTSTATATWVRLRIASSGVTVDNVTVYPFFCLSDDKLTAYEPYENICPISGHENVSVTRVGKNFIENNVTTIVRSEITATANADKSIIINGTSSGSTTVVSNFALGTYNTASQNDGKKHLPNGEYIVDTGTSNSGIKLQICASNNPSGNDGLSTLYTKAGVGTIIIDDTYKYNWVRLNVQAGTYNNVTIKPMIRLASETDATYEPFNGNTYTTEFGQTVYGGYLDVVSGQLTINKATVDLGTLSWSRSETSEAGKYRFISGGIADVVVRPTTSSDVVDIICSDYETGSMPDIFNFQNVVSIYTNGRVYIYDERYDTSDTATFKTAMDGVQLVYPLATPITIQLTPQQIALVAGNNSIWADEQFEIIYHADPSLPKIIPAEAMAINGQYIENLVDGYRTLYTKGREMLSPEIALGEVGIKNGSYIKHKRFPTRVITVGYQLIADTPSKLMESFAKLNDVLNVEDAQIIFADETDKFLTGTPSGYGEVPSGELSIKGEFNITCVDPFKYSVTEYQVTPTLDDGATFLVDYQGTYPAYPVLQTNFHQSETQGDTNGDCGFVAFSTQNADVLQFGDVEEPDTVNEQVQKLVDSVTTTWTETKCLVNEPFNSLTGWTTNDGYTGSNTYVKAGSANVGTIATGSDKAVKASSYGATSSPQWHGVTVKKTIPSDGGNPATTGAKDWKMHMGARYATNSVAKTAKAQAGMIRATILNSSGGEIAGITVFKMQGSSVGKIQFRVGGKTVKTVNNVDLTYYNKYFGYKKKSTDKRGCNFDITKVGDKFTFNAGGVTFSYRQSTLASTIAKSVSIYFAQWGAVPVTSYMGIYSCQFTSTSVTKTKTTETWEQLTRLVEVKNTFTTNDVLVCDCSDGSIRLMNAFATDEINGGLHPELGALGNDWESFVLTKGTNQIGTMYSDWVTSEYKPTFILKYRERFL